MSSYVVRAALLLVAFPLYSCTSGTVDEPTRYKYGQVGVALSEVVHSQVSSSADDAAESGGQRVLLTSADLGLGTGGSAQLVGQRFPSVLVPQGAVIKTARVEYTVAKVSSVDTALTVRAQTSDSAAPFTDQRGNISERALTSNFVGWTPPAWSTVGSKQSTPDLSALVQEVVNRPGWTSGSALSLIISGVGKRHAIAYDGSNADAPLLIVEFDGSSSTSDGNSDASAGTDVSDIDSGDRDSGDIDTGTDTCGDTTCSDDESCLSCPSDCGPCDACSGPDCDQSTPPNLLIAFIGDQGNNGNSDSVLELIRDEGAHAVVHNGDFDYQDNPAAWDDRITTVLGASYPYFSIVGNHDAAAWSGPAGYAARIAARHARNSEMQCTGELGVKANCTFRGLHLVTSCIGTDELRSSCGANSAEHIGFIRDSLQTSTATFKICNWHKNQHDMQVGSKFDEVGWSAYRECMDAGAIVATGHEHSYARTLTLTDVGNAAAGHGAVGAFHHVSLAPGQNFVFVSGLAGQGRRAFNTNHLSDTWWASYYSSTRWMMNGLVMNGLSNYGALFIEFHVDGDAKRARGYFKDISGRVADEFTILVQ